MHRLSLGAGILLIVIGGLLLADNLGIMDFRWSTFWPYLVIAAGLFVCYSWIKDRSRRSILLPGITLLVYGCLFWYCANFGWWRMEYDNLWAFFLIGPGLGFLAMYLAGGRERALLIPGLLFSGLGLLFWFGADNMRYIWPLGLIVLGLEMIRRSRKKLRDPKSVSEAIIVKPTREETDVKPAEKAAPKTEKPQASDTGEDAETDKEKPETSKAAAPKPEKKKPGRPRKAKPKKEDPDA